MLLKNRDSRATGRNGVKVACRRGQKWSSDKFFKLFKVQPNRQQSAFEVQHLGHVKKYYLYYCSQEERLHLSEEGMVYTVPAPAPSDLLFRPLWSRGNMCSVLKVGGKCCTRLPRAVSNFCFFPQFAAAHVSS